MAFPKSDLEEALGTLSCLAVDHYESTHDECDILGHRERFNRLRTAEGSMIECKELVGKVIRACHLYEEGSDGPELQIDFNDGTSFVASLKLQPSLEAKYLQNNGGGSLVLREYKPPAQ